MHKLAPHQVAKNHLACRLSEAGRYFEAESHQSVTVTVTPDPGPAEKQLKCLNGTPKVATGSHLLLRPFLTTTKTRVFFFSQFVEARCP